MEVLHMQMSVIVIDTRFAINLFFCKHPVILFVHCKSYAYDYSFLLFKQVNPYFVPMLENAGLHFVGCDESGNRMVVLSKTPYAILVLMFFFQRLNQLAPMSRLWGYRITLSIQVFSSIQSSNQGLEDLHLLLQVISLLCL